MLASIAITFASASAFAPQTGLVGGRSVSAVNIKSGNAGLYGWQVKKNSKTGDTANLRGYTVGSRAPPMAVSSGTTIAQSGGRYKGVGLLGKGLKSAYTVPSASGDSGLDLRSFGGGSGRSSLFVHNSNMLAQEGEGKDCFINRGKAG